jgi:hypothetical protein
MLQGSANAHRFSVCAAIAFEHEDAEEIAFRIEGQADVIVAEDDSFHFAARISDNNGSDICTYLIVGWETGLRNGITDYLS